jgi:hypothetical protein
MLVRVAALALPVMLGALVFMGLVGQGLSPLKMLISVGFGALMIMLL